MVHQVVVNIAGSEAGELLIEIFVQTGPVFDHILGEFGCNVDFFTDVIALEDFSDRRFASGINIGGVEVVDPGAVSGHDLSLRLFDVDIVAFSCETHAAEAQHRQLVSITIFSVEHRLSSCQPYVSSDYFFVVCRCSEVVMLMLGASFLERSREPSLRSGHMVPPIQVFPVSMTPFLVEK